MSKIKGVTIGSTYSKQGKDLGIAVNKTFMVPVEHLVIESGFNVRDLDEDHINGIAEAYEAGRLMPAIVVKTTADGFKVIDGHHRFEGAKKANVQRLECKEFVGSELDQIAFMVSSSQGRNLLPIERAQAYQRMIGLGMTKAEISTSVSRSRADVDNHLILLQAGDDVIAAVKSGEVSSSEVVKEVRKSGPDANKKIMKEVTKAKATGKKAVINNFKPAHSRQVMEILAGMEREGFSVELCGLIDLYLD